MQVNKANISIKGVVVVLTLALIFPSFLKLSHTFADHEHLACVTPQDTHFHEFNLDCEFYTFQIKPQVIVEFESFELIEIDDNYTILQFSEYRLPSNRSLLFWLRGPPALI